MQPNRRDDGNTSVDSLPQGLLGDDKESLERTTYT